MKQRTLLAIAVLVCLLGATLLAASVASAAPFEERPAPGAPPGYQGLMAPGRPAKITWAPRVLTSTQALAPGQAITLTATFTSSKEITNATVLVSPVWGPRVAATPRQFPNIVAGQTYSMSVVITAPTRGHRGGVTALVQLREGRRMLPNPLLVQWRPRRG